MVFYFKREGRTFKRVTRSAACSSVSPEMSSTMRPILGSLGGGGGVDEDTDSVANHLVRLANELGERAMLQVEFSISNRVYFQICYLPRASQS
jgi:hypothetical protein